MNWSNIRKLNHPSVHYFHASFAEILNLEAWYHEINAQCWGGQWIFFSVFFATPNTSLECKNSCNSRQFHSSNLLFPIRQASDKTPKKKNFIFGSTFFTFSTVIKMRNDSSYTKKRRFSKLAFWWFVALKFAFFQVFADWWKMSLD